ncbi:MAG: hypothetical protein K6F72_00740 [Bacteroidales bacterium]|nr:hypothetical protein [Bacteroidales bacterium]
MKKIIIVCFCALLFCSGCHSSKYVSGDIAGEYFFYFGGGAVLPTLPSITLYADSTFEYSEPGVGGPYHSNGTWQQTSRGLLLSTQFTCVGANVKRIAGVSTMDSIDLFVSFLVSTIQPDSVRIGSCMFFLDSLNHIRTTAEVLTESKFVYDAFDSYPICIHDSVANGNVYQVILVDNPYYPIIDNEVWFLSNDGALKRSANNNTCTFRKAINQ